MATDLACSHLLLELGVNRLPPRHYTVGAHWQDWRRPIFFVRVPHGWICFEPSTLACAQPRYHVPAPFSGRALALASRAASRCSRRSVLTGTAFCTPVIQRISADFPTPSSAGSCYLPLKPAADNSGLSHPRSIDGDSRWLQRAVNAYLSCLSCCAHNQAGALMSMPCCLDNINAASLTRLMMAISTL